MRQPLDGIRIIEFGHAFALPHLTELLADFGAEVIKIETRTRPDVMRGDEPENYDKTLGFGKFNKNKMSVTLNLKTAQGLEIAKSLVRIADIAAENYSPPVMKKWGLDYENLVEIKPDIIMISLPGLGVTGPYSHYKSMAPALTPFTGLTYLWNHSNHSQPIGSPTNYGDYVAGGYGAFAVMAALMHRRRTGEGQYIELSQAEGLATTMGPMYLDAIVNKRNPQPIGNRSHYAAPHGCYRCKGEDRWCVIAVFTDDDWRRFVEAIDSPAWSGGERFSTLLGRLQNVDELDRLIEEWTINHSPYEVMERLQKAGISAGVVQTAEDLYLNDAHLRDRGLLVELEHKAMGKILLEGIPMKMSRTPGNIHSAAPLLGEHTAYVCENLLGMSREEIKRLTEERVLI